MKRFEVNQRALRDLRYALKRALLEVPTADEADLPFVCLATQAQRVRQRKIGEAVLDRIGQRETEPF